MVRNTVEDTLNSMLEAEAERLIGAEKYERTHARKDTRAGYYQRGLETKAGWSNFLKHLKERGLTDVDLFITDKCMGLVESIKDHFPQAQWQRCIVHFYRNVWSVTPKGKIREVTAMLKAIHAQKDLEAAREKARAVAEKLDRMKLQKASLMVSDSIHETLGYMKFPREHWLRIRTNNPLERIMKEIKRRTKVVGCFPDGESALMLTAARLRYIMGKQS